MTATRRRAIIIGFLICDLFAAWLVLGSRPDDATTLAALVFPVLLWFWRQYDVDSVQHRSVRLAGCIAAAGATALAYSLLRTTTLSAFISFVLLLAAAFIGHDLIREIAHLWGRRSVDLRGHDRTTTAVAQSIRLLRGSGLTIGHLGGGAARVRIGPWTVTPVVGFERGTGAILLPDGTRLRPPEGPADGMSARIKRTFDLCLTIPLLIISLPIMAVVAALIALRSGRPVLYSQIRLTVDERPFRIFKFRTMPPDAEPGGRPVWPSASDDRITPIGAVLRRLWLDELPQLFNVLRGDLSLVGPRPERPEFAKEFTKRIPRYTSRHRTRAGITGWAQVCGFVGNTSIRKRLVCDLIYIRRWSPWLDLGVVLMTLCQILRRRQRERFDFVPGRDVRIP